MAVFTHSPGPEAGDNPVPHPGQRFSESRPGSMGITTSPHFHQQLVLSRQLEQRIRRHKMSLKLPPPGSIELTPGQDLLVGLRVDPVQVAEEARNTSNLEDASKYLSPTLVAPQALLPYWFASSDPGLDQGERSPDELASVLPGPAAQL
jgi:hypothetical protein